MKRIIKAGTFCLVVALLFVICLCTTVSAAEPTTAIATTPFEVHQGEQFTTTLYIPGAAEICGIEMTLSYDKDLFTLKNSEVLKDTAVVNANTPGIIIINYAKADGNITKDTPLVELTFNVDENAGIGAYDCLKIDTASKYLAQKFVGSTRVKIDNFTSDFAKLYIYEIGDVDLNCEVDIGDAIDLRRHLAQLIKLSDFQLSFADTYYDGIIDISDPVWLQRRLAKFDINYGNRVNIVFCDSDGSKLITKSVLFGNSLAKIPSVPKKESYSGGKWSLSKTEYIEPDYTKLEKDVTVYAYYDDSEYVSEAMAYYKQYLTDKHYSGDLPSGLSGKQELTTNVNYQKGYHASVVWSSDCNYVLNATTGDFTKPTYPQKVNLTAKIISYDADDRIEAEDRITFAYDVPGMFVTPTKESVADFLRFYFRDESDGKYRVNYDVKLISKLNNVVIPVEGAQYDNFEIRLEWYQNIDGVLTPVSQIKRTTAVQYNDYVAVATFNGKPLQDDGKIYIDDVEVTAIEQMEIKNHIINQIAAKQGTLATDGKELWNQDTVYGTTVNWETGNADIGYVADNVIKLKDNAVSGSVLPLNARVSYLVDNEPVEFILSYNLTVSCDNTIIKAPENMDTELYKAIKDELQETVGYSGDLTSAALASVKFVNLDLSAYPEITSLRGLSYCKNLRTLNISGLHITDGTMNQISTLSYLEAFIARNCELDSLSDGGMATLRNAVNLKMIDLTGNNFTSLDSVFAEGIRYGSLREVYLSDNKLKNIDALSRAPMMTYLSLAKNGLTSDGIGVVADYSCLLYLSLADNQIDNVDCLSNLKGLKELRLQNNNISNVNVLRKLVNLELLYLENNDIVDVGFLNTLTKLQVLYINKNSISDISALTNLSDLKVINVSDNMLTSLAVLKNYSEKLTEIYAENNKLTDFSFINGAVNLHILMLSGNSTTMVQSNMNTWLSALSNMEVLTLSRIQLSDLSFLNGMEKIVRLDVSDCGLGAKSGEISNIDLIADRYDTLRILDISNNDMSGSEDEILKLKNVTLLTVLYADNICDHLDAETLTYSMTELRYISIENCGITSMSWLSKYNNLVYVDLAGNNLSSVNLGAYISNASHKTLKELYLDTQTECTFANAFRITDFNVEKLSLENIDVSKVENLPYMDHIEYINLSNTGLESLTGEDPEMRDTYSVERYGTLKTIDVSYLETDISPLENLPLLSTVYAVGNIEGKQFFENNLHTLQRLYNKGITCYLYDKNTVFEPKAVVEGEKILNLLDDISCDITVASDNVISDNNPFIVDAINDFDITWHLSNNTNYEIMDNHLSIKNYDNICDEELTVTAEITVYPDQPPVTRSFVVRTHVLRAGVAYYEFLTTGVDNYLNREDEFTYSVSVKKAPTEGFANDVKPVVNDIRYSYASVLEDGSIVPYKNVLTLSGNQSFMINSSAPLNSVTTITVSVGHYENGNFVADDIFTRDIMVVSRTFTVRYVANDGVVTTSDGSVITEQRMPEDTVMFENITVERKGYLFEGWYTDDQFTTPFIDNVMPSHDITLYAKWKAHSFNVIFDANGGNVDIKDKLILCDTPFGELPVPTRDYYTFSGWFTVADGGDLVDAGTSMTNAEDITLFAHWTPNKFILTYNANGGIVSTANKTLTFGDSYGTLPKPTRDYYTFEGWYTSENGGDKVSASTTPTSDTDVTIYAHWTENPVSDWILESELPTDAQVTDTKWSYTKKTLLDSRKTSEAGYTLASSEWVQSGKGSRNYASFPSGFDTGNWYYQNYASNPYSAYENATSKRTVKNYWSGYIYWHWMYDCGGVGAYDRAILNKSGYGSNGNYYKYFGAFESKEAYTTYGNYYNNGCGLTTYWQTGRTSYADSQGSYFWFRFDKYTSEYTDYYKLFHYYKEDILESTTQPTKSSTVYNIQKWVQYRAK